MTNTRIAEDEVRSLLLNIAAAEIAHADAQRALEQARLIRTVLYVSEGGQRRRTYPVMTDNPLPPTITTDDGVTLRKVLVLSGYESGHLDDAQMTNGRAA